MEKESSEQRTVEANSTEGQGSRRAVAPSDDDDDDDDDKGICGIKSVNPCILNLRTPVTVNTVTTYIREWLNPSVGPDVSINESAILRYML
jgi:hypothetical protein